MADPILIVDDNALNLRLLGVLLEARGYTVRTAASAEEALVLLETWQPRLILVDLRLPGIDGLELTRRLRTMPATKDLPIVAVTAHAMAADRDAALAAGCDGFVTKPIDTRTLPDEVARYLTIRAR
jgi:CheY-like chemotaxis protein